MHPALKIWNSGWDSGAADSEGNAYAYFLIGKGVSKDKARRIAIRLTRTWGGVPKSDPQLKPFRRFVNGAYQRAAERSQKEHYGAPEWTAVYSYDFGRKAR